MKRIFNRFRRYLYLFHRWAGIVLCGFFALWFASGIFMMYVEYPVLTMEERLERAPGLDFSSARFSPAEAAGRLEASDFAVSGSPRENVEIPVAGRDATPSEIRLTRILGRPAYVFSVAGGAQPRVVFADDGEILARINVGQARDAAAEFFPEAEPVHLGRVQSDQWTVSSAMNAHRPLHHIAIGDAAGTEAYVSSTTGEVVRDSTRRERVLNYFAAVTHWIYPHFLRKFPEAWGWVVNILAGFGCVFALSGMWIGILRARRRQPPAKSVGRRLIHWHYLLGCGFGVVLLTFVFSGWMSMNPGGLNPSRGLKPGERLVFSGKELTAGDFSDIPDAPENVVEGLLTHHAGHAYVAWRGRDGKLRHVPANGDSPAFPKPEEMSGRVLAEAHKLMPDSPQPRLNELTGYDTYYYSRKPGPDAKPLPAVRAVFADSQATWFHLDPETGRIVDRSTRANRLFRHLYNGLHSFDWWWLYSRRPLWDMTVIVFSLGGFLLSLLGVAIGIRRLRVWAVGTRKA